MVNQIPELSFTTTSSTLMNSLKNEVIVEANNKYITTIALWDTGATSTCISKEVANSLGLVPTGKTYINTPSGIGEVDTYLINVLLPNNLRVTDVVACGSEIGNQGIGILLGMNIIVMGDFCISNYNGETHFSFRFPSKEHLDFVKGEQ